MRRWLFASLCMVAACGDDGHGPADAAGDGASDVDANPNMPATLQASGLCDDAACMTINPGILAYQPQYQLYSDGATKKRWLQLPPGTQIDTSDMNFWRFPVGTKAWKEFTRDGVRVETRLIIKVGDDDSLQASWYWASYLWNSTQDAATLYDPQNGAQNTNGTEHDVPRRFDCRNCHEKTPGRILGVNALSLDWPDGTRPADTVGLADLDAMGLLSNPPSPSNGTAYFPLPGTDVDKAAYGFLHANCGGCHNPESPTHDTVSLELRMDVTKLATAHDHPAYTTLVNQPAMLSIVPGTLVIPGNRDDSVVYKRITSLTAGIKMPEVGTETLNQDGIDKVTAWIMQPP